jgi:AraC family transcriptional regulator
MLQVSERCYSPRFAQSKHAHEDTSVTIVLSGWLIERVGSVQELAGPLSVVVKPRGTEHSNIFFGAVRTLQIVVRDSEVSGLERAIPSLAEWRWHHIGANLASFATLLRIVRISGARTLAESAALDTLAALACDAVRHSSDQAPKWLMAIRSEIDESTVPLSVRGLAASAGIPPVYLARQFRRWYGCSMTEYFRSLRVRRAACMMVQTVGSVGNISHRAGFADHAHMCRLFREEVGVKPTEFRRLAFS